MFSNIGATFLQMKRCSVKEKWIIFLSCIAQSPHLDCEEVEIGKRHQERCAPIGMWLIVYTSRIRNQPDVHQTRHLVLCHDQLLAAKVGQGDVG